ncbi:phosphoribosyl-AMP cyclohydrolase [Mycobacterium sp. E2462]|uniref:phosphoribosyl-AMP cyclohydrolase n=1 Tax=unclassified Mycobacterium TaxID=2642494 RepID=UPI0007FC06C8|nr:MULTISPECIES: phosphoribosyl-AMP cyclohydrolase [unclassified Mycobacterium]OBG71698.1 phosphoribosyl-AMP cyclohydrolase [Mycobacterium sp. E1214]OBH28873.1 phosphoribosyl-AMP cyclohydrolase [Mycobacterium sp. E1319]OBI15895.1 phosphoribosyl-AMP cyclohydrolase [Mycobacterium sp. E2462]
MSFDQTVALDFSKLGGLAPVVLQHAVTREVLMVGFVDEEAWAKTLSTGVVTLFRRTLGRVQVKGEDDGSPPLHIQRIAVDCDSDTALLEIEPQTPVCHDGGVTCFSKPVAVRG